MADAFANIDDLIPTLFKFEIMADSFMAHDELMCESCYCEYKPEDIITMPDCGHKLCSYCFTAYLETKLG